jgi:hypothetical protein
MFIISALEELLGYINLFEGCYQQVSAKLMSSNENTHPFLPVIRCLVPPAQYVAQLSLSGTARPSRKGRNSGMNHTLVR